MSPGARRLERRVSGVRAYLHRRAAVAAGLWVGAGVALLLVVAWFLSGPDGWRQGSDVPLLLDGIMLLWLVGAVLFFRAGTARWFGEVPLSATIERAVGLRSGSVRGSLELARSLPRGVSAALATRAAERASSDLDGRDLPELAGAIGDRVTTWARRGLGAVAAAAVVLVLLGATAPDRTARVWAGVSSPFRTMVDPVLPAIVVTPGTLEVLRGSDVHIEIEAQGRLTVQLAWQAAGDVARTERLDLREGRATFVFRSVAAPIEYRVRGDAGGETETFRIVPVDPLFVTDLVLGVTYPPHTGMPPDEYRGDPPPLRLPVGTRLSVEGRATRPLSVARLVDSLGAAALGLSVDGVTFTGSWTPSAPGTFAWFFLDDTGAGAEIQPEPLVIVLVPDSAPSIAIPLPGRDTILPLKLRQPLLLEARDDYGLGRLELVAYRVTAFGERHDPIVQGLDLGGSRAALARPLLDLSTWGLLPGDTVRYFARVSDNSPSPQTTASREYVLRMPSSAELGRAAEEALQEVADRLRELAAEAARQAEQNRNQALEDAARRKGSDPLSGESTPRGFERREEVERALESQAEMASDVDSLRAELETLEELMEEAGQADPELSAELDELQKLLEELTGSELEERMDRLAEAVEQDDLQKATRSLRELAQEQENFRERLEESLERFRRAAVEQGFRTTTREAEEVVRQERALADAMKEEDDPELRAGQQEELEQRAEELESKMARLQERLEQLGEQDAAQGVQEAERSTAEAQQQMQRARRRATEGEDQEAGREADRAAEEMQRAAEQLQEARQQMAQQKAEAVQQALRQAADDALSLARRQTELREQMRASSQEQLAEMRSDEASLLEGVQNMAENLQLATEGALGSDREFSAQMGRTMESMQKTIEAMASRRGALPSPSAQAEQAVGDLNQLALMAIAGAEQMGQQGEGRNGEEMAEQLEQLAQQQGELVNQTGQLMPLQLGEQAMSQQLQELAQGQESVAGDLGEMADRPESEESLGDLQQLAEEAEALAQQLAQGRLTSEMVQRQERLFHRLLDAGRSLEREEFSDERESEQSGVFERGSVLPLTAAQLGAMPYRLPDAERLQMLSPAVRQLVLEYFARLNRGRPGGGAS